MPNSEEISRIIPLELVLEPSNPIRSSFDDEAFFSLVDSMRSVGQLSPLIVKPHAEKFEVVAGHRRLRAAVYLRWPTIEVRVIEGNSDLDDKIKLHENAFREAVAPEDEGRYFEHLAREKKLGVREIAKFTNRSHYYVESRLKLLTYPEPLRDALHNKLVSLGVAEALSEITDHAELRRLLVYAIENGCNVKTAKAWANTWATTQSAVDQEAVKLAVQQSTRPYEEPMLPCFGCEAPVRIGELAIIRLCKRCYHELSTAPRNDPTPSRPDHRPQEAVQSAPTEPEKE